MASCSDPRSRVWSRPRYSPANAASIGGGGTGQVTSVGSHSSAIPAARHAIRRVHEGSRARSAPRSRQITVAIHPSTPARNTTPPATSARCAFSGSRNSFDLMTRIPRNVRNTVGVSGALAHARLPLVVLALALNGIGLVITGERWRGVVAALGSPLRLSRTTLINLAGIFVRNATPTTGLGGDASRIALLRAEGVPLARATASFAYVRLSEVPPLAVVVALSTPAIASLVRRSHTALIVTGAAVVVGMAIAWLARHRLRAHVASIWTRTGHLRIGPAPAARAVCCATLAQVETIARQIVVAAAFGVPLTIQQSA